MPDLLWGYTTGACRNQSDVGYRTQTAQANGYGTLRKCRAGAGLAAIFAAREGWRVCTPAGAISAVRSRRGVPNAIVYLPYDPNRCTQATRRAGELLEPTLSAVVAIKVAVGGTKTSVSGSRALQKIPHFGLEAKKLCDTYPQSPLQVPDGYIDTRHRPNPSNSLPTRCFTRVWTTCPGSGVRLTLIPRYYP